MYRRRSFGYIRCMAVTRKRAQGGDEATPKLKTFSQSLPVMLMRAREAVMSRIRPILRDHDVTEQQWRVLRTLNDSGEIEVSQLARRTFLLVPSLSRILRDLVDRGLIQRRTSGSDLRRGIVSISKEGKALIAAVSPVAAAEFAEMELRYGSARMAELTRLLLELESALDQGADELTPGDGD